MRIFEKPLLEALFLSAGGGAHYPGEQSNASIEQDHRALDAIVRGDQGPKKAVFSHRDDVTLANPLGPPARGWNQVEEALERAASQLRRANVRLRTLLLRMTSRDGLSMLMSSRTIPADSAPLNEASS